jgi:hypothetical protein
MDGEDGKCGKAEIEKRKQEKAESRGASVESRVQKVKVEGPESRVDCLFL